MDTKLQWKTQPGGGISTYGGGVYCGPGWGYTKEDVVSGLVPSLPDAIDAIDRACKAHDQCYQDNGYLTMKCNVKLATQLLMIVSDPKSSPQQRNDAHIMAAIFAIESMSIDVVVFVPKETYRKLHTFIVASWDGGVRTMASIINEGYLRLCSEAARGANLPAGAVCQ